MTSPTPDLAAARAEIDAIDAEMHALLMRRAGIVARIEAAKRVAPGRSAYRPAREADMMRRLVERHRGPFPLASAEHIWREIITAFIRLQAPFTVHLGAEAPEFRDLARFQFGATTTLAQHGDASSAIAALAGRPADLALVPVGDDASGVWWERLGHGADAALVVARIPFLLGAVTLPSAYVVAHVVPEPSGGDRTLYAITGPVTEAPEELAAKVEGAVPIAARIADGDHHVLAGVAGFRPAEAPLPVHVRRVGAYAVPLRTE